MKGVMAKCACGRPVRLLGGAAPPKVCVRCDDSDGKKS